MLPLRWTTSFFLGLVFSVFFWGARSAGAASPPPGAAKLSFYKQIRPVLLANCQGCHQPANASGAYVMTPFEKLLAGGSSGKKAIVPSHPEQSRLVEMITPHDGKNAMPMGKPPLPAAEIDLIKRWIAQGAMDDTKQYARARYDMQHPPVYTRPPVITSLDFSPDGKLLAVAGFHEVLLLSADNARPVARLVGASERIQSVRFSPDGTRLAATGGDPARSGEVQIWNVAQRRLERSVPVTADTINGARWSPDGKQIAFGCADNSVRAINAATGEQTLFMGSHTDWALDTVFTKDSANLISVGRDMTSKLTEVATQRFVDNISSITPGALKGGISSVDRHPDRDEIVIGGSDGIPKVYRVFRLTDRRIGDDSNLIRRLPAMKGRVFSVAVSRDGKRIVAGSSLDGAGEVFIYGYEFDTSLPDAIKKIMAKVSTSRTPEENEALERYHTADVRLVTKVDFDDTAIYAVAFRPDGQQVAAAGLDGTVRLIDAADGKVLQKFVPVPISRGGSQLAGQGASGEGQGSRVKGQGGATVERGAALATRPAPKMPAPRHAPLARRPTTHDPRPTTLDPRPLTLQSLAVQPPAIQLKGKLDYAQLLVTAKLAGGETKDVTRQVRAELSGSVADLSPTGLVRPRADGQTTLRLSLGGCAVAVPLSVAGMKSTTPPDFVRDVAPILSRLGCNAGTCHGSAQGKNGFKLSLRGYDPIFDVRALTDDLAARRVNLASPEDSLMLLKAAGEVPHVGGQVIRRGDAYYETLRNWVASGAKLNPATQRVARIEVLPRNPVVPHIGDQQQMRVIATYPDGTVRDVTKEAFVDSGNSEVATAERGGLTTAIRRGEAPVLVRYEGSYVATTLTVMGDRTGFAWKQPPANNRIDELAASKWRRMKIQPSELCSDTEFVRRVYLDLSGVPPSTDNLRAFLADKRASRVKRDALVDQLVGSKEYVEFWTNKWADLLQVNRKFLDVDGAVAFRKWIHNEIANNTPYDQFVRKILTATGSNRENPAASYFKILRDPAATAENTTQLFLGVRFNCTKCHDHPFERWTQNQYYQLSAYFARVDLQPDPAGGNKRIGGTAVEGAKPVYEMVVDKSEGEVIHQRTGQPAPPQFPYPCDYQAPADATRRAQLAAWLTSKDNAYFAKSYVNRLWGYLFGVGIIEPIDDIRAGNPPTNPELLDYLTSEFIRSGFDVRPIMKMICKSRTYQLSVTTNRWNDDDRINYAHATARRLPAEVLLDAVYRVTGGLSKFPGVPPGTRAAELPDSGVELPSGFLTTFGRPPRESACECERTSGLQLGPVMALVSGPTIAEAISDPNNEVVKLVAQEKDDRKWINELFMRILNRPAAEKEIQATLRTMGAIDPDHRKLATALEQREKEAAPIHVRKEQDRVVALAKAKDELTAYEKELAPKLVEQERQKQEKTVKLTAELAEYEKTLPTKLTEYEKTLKNTVAWVKLDPKTLQSTNGAKLSKEADFTIVTTDAESNKGALTVVAETDLKNITGIRLEVLADKRLPMNGPGRAPDGNFVLTEFEMQAAPKAHPDQTQKMTFEKASADFSQQNFEIAKAIDADLGNNSGWGVSPSFGVTHWATFEPKEAVGFDGGTVLTFTLHHQFNKKEYLMGRFRISVTTAPRPVGLGLADELATIVTTAPEQRTEAQQTTLLTYFRAVDKEFRDKQTAIADSKKPLPIDPHLKELQDNVAYYDRPTPTDPLLVQLRHDVEMSTKQNVDKRLTTAQDLAWALLNSPAFLFNH